MQKTGRLELTWVGKYNEPVLEPRILLEDKSKSHGDPQSENMLIHGDNLIALQALQQDYAGRIKCIFIDPPYNTGAAFEHYDDNVEHSTWLSLMKSRLVLLHQLLADNGTIFIQIDDNEQAYLKVLCDEIFGRQNYINMVSVNAKVSAGASGGGEDKRLKKNIEYILIYAMCIHDGIKPKYVVSTATIKNAEAQTRCLYARKNTTQFPPNGFEIGDSFFIREIPVENDPFRKYVGVCAPGQSVKTALLRVYAIILQAAYTYSLQDEYKEVIDPYYSLVGYFNSIRELGGAVRLLQDDIPKRIYRIKNKYGLDKQRYLNHNVEITSRMSSYKIPEKLNQLETTCDSKECLDTAIATNMIAVGMDVDRLGLMVVTGQPKQNSEYIQATSRIGRAFPGLVVTLYNAYRPRDLSHYENFTGYHSQLYRFVEGTTATPFSARARDRVMHALVISAIRLNFPNMANNPDAAAIGSLTKEQLDSVKSLIIDRLNIIKPSARADAEEEIDRFIDWWKLQAAQTKPLRYYVVGTERYNRLMNPYDQPHDENEKATLRSMREVESSANMFYYTEE